MTSGFFIADGVFLVMERYGKADWYAGLMFVLAALALLGVWMGWRRVRETGVVFIPLAIFLALFGSALPDGDLEGIQLLVAGLVFVLAMFGYARDPAAITPASSLRPVPTSRHIILPPQALPWFWTAVATGLAAIPIIDAASFLRGPANVKTPGNVTVACLIVFVIAVGLLLAWRRVSNAGVVFVVVSIFCFLFAGNLGSYNLGTLLAWQLGGSLFLFLVSLFGLVTTPSQTQNASQLER